MTDTEPEVTQEALLASIRDFDNGVDIDAKSAREPAKAEDSKPVEAKEPDSKEAVVEKGQEAAKDSKANESKDHEKSPEKVKSKWAANEERKAKTWQDINADKEAIKAEREALQRDREEFQKARVAPAEGMRDEHGATAKDYRDAAQQFKANGDNAMAEAAEKLAGNIEAKEQSVRQQNVMREGQEKWVKNLAALTEKHPELKQADSELSKAALQVLAEFPMLKQDPNGITYAVKAAQINLQARDFEGTKAEFAKLKAEHEKLQKKLTISGGSPTSPVPEAKSFADMSLDEQRKSLEQAVGAYDRDNGY